MGGLFHLVDSNQGRMARKVVTQKRHGGLEAPRNSLDLPVETCQSYFTAGDDWSEKNCYPTEAPMKKLIREEISRRPKTRANSPSIVARLMGVDTLPLDTKPVAQQVAKKNENLGIEYPEEKLARTSSVGHGNISSRSSQQISFDSFQLEGDSDADEWSGSLKSRKPKPREHPQEEELEKFKKDFEAWQSARLKECSKIVERGTTSSQWMAQENLNKEKMIMYANSVTKSEKGGEVEGHTQKSKLEDRGSSRNGYKNELLSAGTRSRTLSRDFELPLSLLPDREPSASSAPTRIVILRPGLDSIGNNEEPWASSSHASEERGSIEDFLEEVKERLKSELQGKTVKRGSMVRGGGIETPYSEKPSDPKQIAQRIAKQVRESVTRDLGMNLLRSESTRSYRSEIQYNGTSSPEFISRDTRRFLSERLRNVLRRESHQEVSKVVDGSSGSSRLAYDRRKLQSREILKDENDIQSRSFRCGPNDDLALQRDLSPRNLIRSLSAPVSGTSFGKLLLEDRHVVTGAHIRRKHEAIEKLTVKVKKQSKEKFNFKEKVSSFKYSFILRGRLFGRKIHSAVESRSNERDFVKDIMSGPTVMMNFSDRPENATEVPPSPASVCSSVHEEFWRAANCPSPSTPGATPFEENDLPQAFRDISYNLNVLRKQLNQLETGESEEAIIEEQPRKPEMVELEDQEEAYVRDLLVASGLYDNSSDKSLSRWDPFAKPISIRVFEEVEDAYKKKSKENEGSKKKVDHKVLLDLLNEALSVVLAPPVHMSKFRRTAIGTVFRPPYGKTLLDHVWEIMRVYLSSPAEKSFYSFDSMVARDLHSNPWSGLINDDLDALGKEMEFRIIEDLIEEMVKDMNS